VNPVRYEGGLTCAIEVSSLDASLMWYRDVLGFKLLYTAPNWCELATDVAGVTVGLSQVARPRTDGGVTLTFGVADIEQARANLKAMGVQFEGEIQTIEGLTKLATFKDPDGTRLMLFEDLRGKKPS
jgi:predicted enzyme related to lactoylglutathione lyase